MCTCTHICMHPHTHVYSHMQKNIWLWNSEKNRILMGGFKHIGKCVPCPKIASSRHQLPRHWLSWDIELISFCYCNKISRIVCLRDDLFFWGGGCLSPWFFFFFSPKIEETVHVTAKTKEFRITFIGHILNDLNLLTRYQFIDVPPPPNSATRW